MNKTYTLVDMHNLRLQRGDYYCILDAIVYYDLNLGEYTVEGCEIPLDEIHKDAMALSADLAERFDALLV